MVFFMIFLNLSLILTCHLHKGHSLPHWTLGLYPSVGRLLTNIRSGKQLCKKNSKLLDLLIGTEMLGYRLIASPINPKINLIELAEEIGRWVVLFDSHLSRYFICSKCSNPLHA